MTKSIPAIDSLGWGEGLNDHLGQLIDPAKGGFNTVADVAERDSKFWGNGASDKDAFANKTIFLEDSGIFQVWTVEGSIRFWKDLQRNLSAEPFQLGIGTISGYGNEIRGVGTNFLSLGLDKGSVLKVSDGFPSGHPYIVQVQEVISDTVLKGFLFSKHIRNLGVGSSDIIEVQDTSVGVSSISGNTVIFDASIASFNLKPGDSIRYYGTGSPESDRGGVVLSSTTTSLTVEKWMDNGLNSPMSTPVYSGPGIWINQTAVNRSYSYKKSIYTWKNENEIVGYLTPTGKANFSDIAIENKAPNGHRLYLSTMFNMSGWAESVSLIMGREQHSLAAIALTDSRALRLGVVSQDPANPSTPGIILNSTTTVNGNLAVAGTVTQNSDITLKKDIKVVDGALAKISQIKGVTYKWKKPENHGDDGKEQLGVIAQDVEKVFPQAVKTDPEGIMSVSYGDMVAPLIEAVKELKLIIDQQQNEIEELRSVISHHA